MDKLQYKDLKKDKLYMEMGRSDSLRVFKVVSNDYKKSEPLIGHWQVQPLTTSESRTSQLRVKEYFPGYTGCDIIYPYIGYYTHWNPGMTWFEEIQEADVEVLKVLYG